MATWHADYTIEQYDELIRLAETLGFADDVEHWRAKRAKAVGTPCTLCGRDEDTPAPECTCWCHPSSTDGGTAMSGENDSMSPDAARVRYSDVQPGDRLTFEKPGVAIFGGAVWQSPTTGDIIAGDTFLTLHGHWLPEPTDPDTTLTIDSTHRRAGEAWNPMPEHKPTGLD